jgi:asparagine synthase (glutamine-hydrolysing)
MMETAAANRVHEICAELQIRLEKSVRKNLSDGILFSGGLDTSILALVASKFASLKAFTIGFRGAPAPDIKYATLMADKLKLQHFVYHFDEDELYSAIREVVKITKSFDPMEVRNSITIYIGLKFSKEHGTSKVMTGDGCDELFAGYSFLFNLKKEQLDQELQKMWNQMHFSSVPLAEALGLEAKLPYLDADFKSFAMKIDSKYKICKEKGKIWGKWILRKAFETFLPQEIVWRTKTPIECGSGTTTLPEFFNKRISNEEFEDKKRRFLERDKVRIRDKEQLFYYEVYRSIIGVPHPTNLKGKICPQCHSNVAEKSTYCRTCGAYPI